jgi:small ligand-binding sensory domain FIST
MRWTSALSEDPTLYGAVSACSGKILEELRADGAPDLVMVFASPHYDREEQRIAAVVQNRFPRARVIGCMGAGIIGDGLEIEGAPALSLTAAHLPGVTLSLFHLTDTDLPTPDDGPDAWRSIVGTEPDAYPHFILLVDPFSMNTEALLGGLDFAFPSAAKIGGLASGGSTPGSHALYLNDEEYRDGAVGIAMTGNLVVDTVVAQGCRPIGKPMRVTEVDQNMLVTIDDKPPMETLQELFREMEPREQALAQRNLFIGVAMDPLVDNAQRGDFLIRNIVGVNPSRGTIAVGTHLREGQFVQFHVRDADTSAEDLRGSLTDYLKASDNREVSAALMFQCTGRGRGLYGQPGHDTSMFHELLGALPVGGFFCNGEIGPVAGETYLHGYTSSFAIFRERAGHD